MTYQNWSLLEKSGVAREFIMEYCRVSPYFCIFTYPYSLDQNDTFLYQLANASTLKLERLVMALRLFKNGTIINPHYVVKYLRSGGMNYRFPGLYRETFLNRKIDLPYELLNEEIPAVEFIARILLIYENYWSDPAADIAIRNFRWSHGPNLNIASKLLFMFTTIEAIFGMFHEKYSDSGIGKRIGVAYKPDDIDGVSNFIENTLRNMRNKVAHGESASLENTGEDVIVSATGIPLFPMLLLYPFL